LNVCSKKSTNDRALAVRGAALSEALPTGRGRETPFRQGRTDGARSQFRAEHPLRRDGQADIGEHGSSYAFRSAHPQSALNADANSELSRRNDQNAAFSLEIDDGLMLAQLAWRRRRARAIEVGGRAQDEPLASCERASGQGRVHHLSHPERHIDPLLDEVDLTVVQNDLEVQLRILQP
jgi:hypothetical protein